MAEPDPFATARYLNLATFRRDGRAVLTPVWFVTVDDDYYCFSAGDAGKVKRLRRNASVRIAPCGARGGLRGDWHEASATLVSDPARQATVYRALRERYGIAMAIADCFAILSGRRRRRAVIRIEHRPG